MNKNFTRLELKWGLIFFLVSMGWVYFERLMGWHSTKIDQHATMTSFFAIPAILIYVFALLDKRKNHYNNIMTWSQGFKCGMMITLFIVILAPVGQLITHLLISPSYFENIINYTVDVQNRNRNEAENYFNLKSYMLQSVIGALVMGIVTSAIVAVFVRRNPPQG